MDVIYLISEYEELKTAGNLKQEECKLDYHSARIEGCALTEIETQGLINEGLTPKGKPLNDSLMVTDHHKALLFVLGQAETAKSVSTNFIKEVNGLVMHHTGKVYSTVFGDIDSSTGAFRKGNVVAGDSYFPNFDKVERLTNALAEALSDAMTKPLSQEEQLNLSFDAHFNLVSIHPFYDGNGRTSRLLMNFIQAAYDLPLAIVHSDTKTDYYEALIQTRKDDNIQIFRYFMYGQYERQLSVEINKIRQLNNPDQGFGFGLML